MTAIVGPRKKSQKTKNEATANHRYEKKGTTGQKNTKTSLKMIGAKFSFKRKSFFVQDSMRNLYAVQRSCEKNILSNGKGPRQKDVLEMLSVNGPGAFVLIEGMLNSKVYLLVIKKGL